MSYMIHLDDIKKVMKQQISNFDIGGTFLYKNKVLMVKSSSQIFFLKLEEEKDKLIIGSSNPMKWVKYHELDIQGFFVSMRGSNHVQIVTDTLVYFYSFEEEIVEHPTYIPQLMSVMNNYMGCISLIVDNQDKICVTFKSGQPHFNTYKRKFDHGFREIIDATSREGCCGINVPSKGFFLISDDDFIQVHNEKTYKCIYK